MLRTRGLYEIRTLDRVVKDEAVPLPSFFVVGPPRTGTSWLHQVLSSRTTLPSPIKETRFFDNHFHRGLSWYKSHFRAPDRFRRVGEIAPTYFASNHARERIALTVPRAKIVCIFRNPVERILSLYRLKRAYGRIPWGLDEAMVRDPELVESSKYATKLRLWQKSLGEHRVLATVYDDLQREPQNFVDTLADFISVPRFTLSESEMQSVFGSEFFTEPRNYYSTRGATLMADWLKARRLGAIPTAVKKSPLLRMFVGGGAKFTHTSPDVSERLCKMFTPEVEELEELMKRRLTEWKLPLLPTGS